MKKAFIATLILLFANSVTAQIFELQETTTTDSISAYGNDYAKVKQLYVERLNSQSHLDMVYARNIFISKIKVKTNEYLGGMEEIMKFISDNIEKTDFKDFKEAKDLFKVWEEKSDIEQKKNKKFHDYLLQSSIKHGAQFYIDLEMEMRREYPEKFGVLPSGN